MATGQDLLNRMEILDNELQNQTGEVDVVRSLIALNIAQDYYESIAALNPDIHGDAIGTVSTAASTESTAFPSGLLRLDDLQFIDPATSRPSWFLDKRDFAGGHTQNRLWPLTLTSPNTAPGRPRAYWEDGRNIYWAPLPDAIYTVRWYGFSAAVDITAGGTFLYPDILMLPFASFATKVMAMGVGDETSELDTLAQTTFGPVVRALSAHNRAAAPGYKYRYVHST